METLNFSSLLEAHVMVFAICILTGFVFYKLGEKFIPKQKRKDGDVVIKNCCCEFHFWAHIVFTLARAFFLSLPITFAIVMYVEPSILGSDEMYTKFAINDIIACILFIAACCSVATGICVGFQLKKGIASPNLDRWYLETQGPDYIYFTIILLILLLILVFIYYKYSCSLEELTIIAAIFYLVEGFFGIHTFVWLIGDFYVPSFGNSWD